MQSIAKEKNNMGLQWDITPRRREKLLKCFDGCNQNLPLLYHITSLVRCDDILDLLISSNLTGFELFSFWQTECSGSFLDFDKKCLSYVEMEKKINIVQGKDLF